ncbi:MAG: tRNA (adenosine(37)-N6)-threonylcarbamoyltransferase complex ATPase subunit type 1 TsaE [Eubacteriales bacterium]|nr:tRNA (adenosine(37)-N6)-threonylcarbamoyltransferase complex ATPase subunit type 1 TsaE [Eubacteriales bacterium]
MKDIKGMIELVTNSENETVEIGQKLGSVLKPGAVVCLIGEIGAGKTAFTRGIAKALGITEHITSPTFTIVNEYDSENKIDSERKLDSGIKHSCANKNVSNTTLYHFDVYRLEGSNELEEIGFEEYLSGNGIIVVEWAEKVGSILPEQRINVKFSRDVTGEPDKRILRFEFSGEKYAAGENEFKGMVL